VAGKQLKKKLSDDRHCFACGPLNPIGLRMEVSFRDNKASSRLALKREFHITYRAPLHVGEKFEVQSTSFPSLALVPEATLGQADIFDSLQDGLYPQVVLWWHQESWYATINRKPHGMIQAHVYLILLSPCLGF